MNEVNTEVTDMAPVTEALVEGKLVLQDEPRDEAEVKVGEGSVD